MRAKLPLRTNEDQGERLGWSRGLALRLGRVLARSWVVGAVAIAFYLALFLVTLARFPYFSPYATVDEQLAYYEAARNFNKYGFLNSMLLQDMSSSSRPEHHPFIYSHMPPGPEIVVALLMRLFGENFVAIRLIFAGIFVLGAFYFLRFTKIVLYAAGLVGSGFAMFLVDPPAIMHAIDHPAYSPFPLLTFLPLVALKSYYDHGRRLAFGAAVAAVFVASVYLVYPQLLMALVSWIALSLLGIIRVDRRHLLVFSGAVTFGVLLHFFQNLLFLGPWIFLKELQFTLANRMFALPISDELRAMYQSIGVVHQGFYQFDVEALWGTICRALYIAGSPGISWTLMLLVVLSLMLSLARASQFDRNEGVFTIRRGHGTAMLRYFGALAMWVVATIVLPLLTFPAYSVSYQPSAANRFFLAVLGTAGMAYLGREVVGVLRRLRPPSSVVWKDWRQTGLVCLGIVLLIGTLHLVYRVGKAYRAGARVVVKESTRDDTAWQVANALQPLKGEIVMTNVYPTLVSFFTREATFGGCESAAFPSQEPVNQLVNDDLANWSAGVAGPVDRGVVGKGLTFEPDLQDGRTRKGSGVLRIPNRTAGQFRLRVRLPRQQEPFRAVAIFWVKTSLPRRVRLFLEEPEARQKPKFSAFHSGDGQWELLSVDAPSPAKTIEPPVFDVGIQVEAGVPMSAELGSAGFYSSASDGVHDAEWAEQIVRTHRAADSASVGARHSARPETVDPSKCHTVWIRGDSATPMPKPSHYILFRRLFPGITLCREPECLDRLEEYIASRYPRTFINELCTVFSLDETKRLGETR